MVMFNLSVAASASKYWHVEGAISAARSPSI
jgi:hypothetical protein